MGERREIPLAAGDKILLQANRTRDGLVNGQVGTVKTINDGRITLNDGRVLPADYRQFSHGYCVTSYASQSRTVDSVFLVASSRSAPAIHREQFYVSISRGRQECRIFTDDKEVLRDRIDRTTHRQAALDLVRDALVEQGLAPKIQLPPPKNKKVPPRIRPLRGISRGRRVPLVQQMAGISRAVLKTISAWQQRIKEVVQPVPVVAQPQQEISLPKIKQRQRDLSR